MKYFIATGIYFAWLSIGTLISLATGNPKLMVFLLELGY